MKSHVGFLVVGLITATAGAARAQEPPPVGTPPSQNAPVVQAPPTAQTPPPAQPPVVEATQIVPAPTAAPVAAPRPLSPEEIRARRNAIFLMEGVLVNAVRLAAGNTAEQIQAVQPTPLMFTAAPAKAHGSHLEGYGVFFHVEIPSVMPSVASLFETIERERLRGANPAQQTSLGAGTNAAMLDPDAHYVDSVKRQLVNAMLDHSKALDLSPEEWLTVEAREAQETPGQISQPSTLVLRVRGADLAQFLEGRLSRDEVRKRVQVRGF